MRQPNGVAVGVGIGVGGSGVAVNVAVMGATVDVGDDSTVSFLVGVQAQSPKRSAERVRMILIRFILSNLLDDFSIFALYSSNSGRSAVRPAHRVWDAGVPGSNPGAPTKNRRFRSTVFLLKIQLEVIYPSTGANTFNAPGRIS